MNVSCLTVVIQRVGGIVVDAARVGGMECIARLVGGMDCSFVRIGGMDCEFKRKGGMSVNLGLVCGTNLDEFKVLWASDYPLLTVDNGYLIVD